MYCVSVYLCTCESECNNAWKLLGLIISKIEPEKPFFRHQVENPMANTRHYVEGSKIVSESKLRWRVWSLDDMLLFPMFSLNYFTLFSLSQPFSRTASNCLFWKIEQWHRPTHSIRFGTAYIFFPALLALIQKICLELCSFSKLKWIASNQILCWSAQHVISTI